MEGTMKNSITLGITVLIFLLLTSTVLVSVDYDPQIFSHAEALAFQASERHKILTTVSVRDFHDRYYYRSRRRYRRRRYKSRKTRKRNYGRRYSYAAMLPTALYSVQKKNSEYVLTVRKLSGSASIVLLSKSMYNSRTRKNDNYSLRSITAIKSNNDNLIRYKNTTLGPKQGLHFLATSTSVSNTQFGEAYTLTIPAKVIYGYWQTRLHQLEVSKGSELRIAFYDKKYAASGSYRRTFRILIDK